jgi:hypothetical protein
VTASRTTSSYLRTHYWLGHIDLPRSDDAASRSEHAPRSRRYRGDPPQTADLGEFAAYAAVTTLWDVYEAAPAANA